MVNARWETRPVDFGLLDHLTAGPPPMRITIALRRAGDITTMERSLARRKMRGLGVIPARAVLLAVLQLIVLGLTGFPISASAQPQAFQILKLQVCANRLTSIDSPCTEVRPPFNNLNRASFSNNRIDFKIVVGIDKDTLTFIEANNYVLPVNMVIWSDGRRLGADTDIGLSQEKWEQDGDKIRTAVNELGTTPWRTRGNVQIGRARTIGIEIHDSSDIQITLGNASARLNFSFSR